MIVMKSMVVLLPSTTKNYTNNKNNINKRRIYYLDMTFKLEVSILNSNFHFWFEFEIYVFFNISYLND